MKRMLIVVLLIIVVLVLGSASYLFINATELSNRFKPDLELAASKALGARVELGEISIGFLPVALKIDQVQIARLNDSGKDDGLSLAGVSLKLDLGSLLSGRLVITSLYLDKPDVTFIKEAKGLYLDGFPPTEAHQRMAPAGLSTSKTRPASSTASPLEIALNDFRILDGTIRLQDKVQQQKLRVTKLNISAQIALVDQALSLPTFKLSGLLPGDVPVEITAQELTYNQKTKQLKMLSSSWEVAGTRVQLATDFQLDKQQGQFTSDGLINLVSLRPFLTALKIPVDQYDPAGDIRFKLLGGLAEWAPIDLSGWIDMKGVGAKLPTTTVDSLRGRLQLAGSKERTRIVTEGIEWDMGSEPFKAIFSATASTQGIDIENLTLDAAGGTFGVKGQIVLQSPGSLNFVLRGADLGVEQLQRAITPRREAALVGQLTSLKAEFRSVAGYNLKALEGKVNLSLQNGELRHINLAREVLMVVSNLPLVSGDARTATEGRESMKSEHTSIKQLQGNFDLADEVLSTKDLQIESLDFFLKGRGKMGLNGKLDLAADLYFVPELSEQIASKLKETRKLHDDQHRLLIPLILRGVAPKLSVLPNTSKLANTVAGKELEDRAVGALNRLLGGK